jgi:predicted transcriptional regulator
MTQTEIKQEIHSRLDSVNDDSILEIVYDILANGVPISNEILTNSILNQKIDRGLDDIKHGRLISDEQANNEIEEWLNK